MALARAPGAPALTDGQQLRQSAPGRRECGPAARFPVHDVLGQRALTDIGAAGLSFTARSCALASSRSVASALPMWVVGMRGADGAQRACARTGRRGASARTDTSESRRAEGSGATGGGAKRRLENARRIFTVRPAH